MFDVIKQDLEALEGAMIASVESSVDLITKMGTHLVESGGKRLRPALYFLALHSGKKADVGQAMPLAVALEMIHMASLVHDDVIDSAGVRRGAPTANARWGNQAAILGGDYLFARAFSLVAENDYDKRVTRRLATLICDLSAGEIIQNKEIYKASRDEAEYYERIAKKTANFLAVCCELGGIVAGLPEDEVTALYQYGKSLGMAFQITDDLLDLTAESDVIGKPAGNDILQGIVTLPVIRALEVSPKAAALEEIVTCPSMSAEMLAEALEIVKDTDGLAYAQAKVDEYLNTACNILPENMPEEIRDAYLLATDYVRSRKY